MRLCVVVTEYKNKIVFCFDYIGYFAVFPYGFAYLCFGNIIVFFEYCT